MAKAKPSMASGEKFLLSSCFLPIAASCWSSGATLSRRLGAMFANLLVSGMQRQQSGINQWQKDKTVSREARPDGEPAAGQHAGAT